MYEAAIWLLLLCSSNASCAKLSCLPWHAGSVIVWFLFFLMFWFCCRRSGHIATPESRSRQQFAYVYTSIDQKSASRNNSVWIVAIDR